MMKKKHSQLKPATTVRVREALKLMKMLWLKYAIWVTAVGHIITLHLKSKLVNIGLQRL